MNKQFLLAARPEGMVRESDFMLVETPIQTPEAGDILVEVQYMGLEPAMRGWMENRADYIAPLALGDVMRGFGAGRVSLSNNADYPVGSLVTGSFGWQQYYLHKADATALQRVPEGVSLRAAIGIFGITGMTAWFGLERIGKPTDGDIFVVSSAAGATGSVAGQLAKIRGCRVVGITSSATKCEWLTDTLGFDAAVNYRDPDWQQQLAHACPDGIDIYFDNAGGEILNTALGLIRNAARVVLCGGISRYNASSPLSGPANYFNLIFRRASMQGFIVLDHTTEFSAAIEAMQPLVASGKLQHADTLNQGFEALPSALIALFQGANQGKQLVAVSAQRQSL
ncbi:MAG: NADP-dependent oxidoreductase [Porticoccaceae bacterium]|nr:NADP-dependent oxidoreductase [Porticoccaceae bacterium]